MEISTFKPAPKLPEIMMALVNPVKTVRRVDPFEVLGYEGARTMLQNFTLRELLELRSKIWSPILSDEIRYQIRQLQKLYKLWLVADMDHRNIECYRTYEGRLTCSPLQFVELTRLVLTGTGMKELPAGIRHFENLTCLYLDGNALQTIPAELLSCRKTLLLVDLSHNELEDFPEVLTSLSNLKHVTVSFNRGVKALPDDIGVRLPDLRGIGAYECSLTMIPDSLIELLMSKEGAFANVSYNNFPKNYMRDLTRRYAKLREAVRMIS